MLSAVRKPVRVVHSQGRPCLAVRASAGRAYRVDLAEGARSDCDEMVQLLGLMVAQAHSDGMSSINLGVSADGMTPTLRYYGPGRGPGAEWWDMTACPGDVYSALVQAIVAHTVFEPGVEPNGTLQVVVNGAAIDVRVRIESWRCVLLRW